MSGKSSQPTCITFPIIYIYISYNEGIRILYSIIYRIFGLSPKIFFRWDEFNLLIIYILYRMDQLYIIILYKTQKFI